MGIYISNMDMPTTCGKCKLKSAIECEKWKHVRSIVLDRHRNCPLVPAELLEDIIDAAPAIIPAEEGE